MSDNYDGPELVRQVRMLREENERLRLHIDKRAAGVDPLTQQLRERAERAEAERDALRADAERYRFVRTADTLQISDKEARDPVAYDAAIDAAMKEST